MCGIAGYVNTDRVDDAVLDSMVKALSHRGPDDQGMYRSERYQAGMRRLSINDLHTGSQPLFNSSRSTVLMYNGEIYNAPKLRSELENKGYSFNTRSDGEVICHLYDEIGESLFERLDGMFAVALWDDLRKRLILARDIPGEKPLYYSKMSDTSLVFASEIKSLVKFPGLDLTIDYQSVWDYPTFLWIPEPATIYSSIKSLMPGHILVVDETGIRETNYGNSFNAGLIDQSDEGVIRETRRVVEEAVTSRLLSDVPVGCFLSSGLDSSIVTSIASRHLDNLTTFTIGFEEVGDPYHGKANEAPYAESYAKKLGTTHHTIKVTGKTFLDNLLTFCRYGDQPFAVSSGLGILSIAKASHDAGIKVLLSGDGADECFSGYSWYEFLASNDAGTDATVAVQDDISFQNFGLSLSERLKALYAYSPQVRAWAWHYYASENEKGRLFSKDAFMEKRSSIRYFDRYNASDSWMPEDFIAQDRDFYFPNEMLRKIDRMTMAYSVEGRAPFAAPSVLSHASKLRNKHQIRDGQLKWALRKAFEDILPPEVISRPKHGFNVPIDLWLNNEWSFLVNETFSKDSALYKHGLIHKESLKNAWDMLKNRERLNGHTIFCYIMLNLWLENCKGSEYGNNS